MAKQLVKKYGFRKPDIHVLLQENVPGLGEKGEIVLSGLGYARNYLIPFKLAYYVPRFRGFPILPPNWEPKSANDADSMEVILPAFFEHSTFSSKVSLSSSDISKTAAKITSEASNTNTLSQMESLSFVRPLIDAKEKRTFGSVTADDIATLLKNDHNVTIDKSAIQIEGGRIKEVGTHQVMVKIGNMETKLSISVRPE